MKSRLDWRGSGSSRSDATRFLVKSSIKSNCEVSTKVKCTKTLLENSRNPKMSTHKFSPCHRARSYTQVWGFDCIPHVSPVYDGRSRL